MYMQTNLSCDVSRFPHNTDYSKMTSKYCLFSMSCVKKEFIVFLLNLYRCFFSQT